MAKKTRTKDTLDRVDAFTLELGYADVLAQHVEERLDALSDSGGPSQEKRELYALHLIMTNIRAVHARVKERAFALVPTGGAR